MDISLHPKQKLTYKESQSPKAKAIGMTTTHYWKPIFCRGLDLGHSAKALFAEGQPQEPSAKIGPRQKNGPRQNKSLPRAQPSANWPSANMAGWVTAATGVSLCRVPAVRHSAKIFYFLFLNFLCRGPLAKPLAKIPFAEGQARPSAKIFYFFLNFLCRGPLARPSAKIFFLFFEPSFFVVL